MLAIIYIFNYIDRLVVSILIEPIKAEFGVSDTLIGLVSGVAFALFYTIFGIPFSRLADRIGRKPVIAMACVAWSVMTMLCGVTTSFALLLLCRIGVAVGEAGGSAPSVAMVSALYPPAQRSRALAVLLMGPALGAVFGLGIGGWIAETYGWRWAFIATGAPGVLLGVLLALTVREPAKAPVPKELARDEGFFATLTSLLKTPSYLLIILGASIAAIAGYAIATWNPSFLIRSHGLSLKQAGLLMGLGGGLIAVLGTLACGWFTDRMTARHPGWQLGAALFGSLLSIPFCLAFYLWPAGTAFELGAMPIPTAFFFYCGFAFFGMWWSVPCFGSMSLLFPPHKLAQGTAMLFMGITLFGVGLGPLVIGVISDVLEATVGEEALRYSLASTAGLLALSCVCLAMAIPRYLQQVTNNPLAPVETANPLRS
ncbi:spinster family MFS transporter [Pseudomonas marincola]|uniref:spinster family MFS transporter n=1 Tax=Pseudomonas marincola TaxID=437900 RepID=UPI000B842CD3|nr:MFS transporter [Pseudomonas marincola]